MKALVFELQGKMAHFRKYYSNSTALTYLVPPVITIKGILAGILGYERDTYYELFSNAHCRIAIGITKPIKKITQTMNLLKVENVKDLAGQNHIPSHVQNHTEFVIPQHICQGEVSYQIVVCHDDESIMNQLEQCLCHEEPLYVSHGISVALGSSQCIGWIGNAYMSDIDILRSSEQELDISSVVVLNRIHKICLENKSLHLFKEENITEFDMARMITMNAKKNILVGLDNRPVKLILNPDTAYFTVQGRDMVFVE